LHTYSTKQKRAIFEYMSNHIDETFSARDIYDALFDKSINISTVYRNLASLKLEGKVMKVLKNGSRKAYYRYAEAEKCRSHLHLFCVKCGKTYHMDIPSTNMLVEKVSQNSNFEIDRLNTVLQGICGTCRKK